MSAGTSESLTFTIEFFFEQAQAALTGLTGALGNFKQIALEAGAAAAAIVTPMVFATKTFADFEAVLNGVQSVSEATAAEMELVKERALELGAATQFSAKQAAEGFYELGKAGFQVSEQLDAMNGVLDLAAAGQVSVARAAEVSAGILRGFGLAASEAGRVADQLAQSANASAVDVSDLQLSMKYIAPIAKAAGISLSEVTGILAVLGNQLIKGEQAGTVFRGTVDALVKPTDEAAKIMNNLGISVTDTRGRMLPLTDVVSQFREKMAGLTEAQKTSAIATIFGQNAMSGMLALINQAPGSIEAMVQMMEESDGAAQRMADGLNRGLKFAFEQLAAAVETLAIQVGEDLAPTVEMLTAMLTNLISAVSAIPDPVRKAALGIAAFVASALTLVSALGAIAAILPALQVGLGLLSGPVGWAILGVSALATAGVALASAFKKTGAASKEAVKELKSQQESIAYLASRYEDLTAKINRTAKEEAERLAIVEKLEKLSPSLVSGYDAQGRATDINREALAKYNSELRETLRLQKEGLSNQLKAARQDAAQHRIDLIDASQRLRDLQQQRQDLEAEIPRLSSGGAVTAAIKARTQIKEMDAEIARLTARLPELREKSEEAARAYLRLKNSLSDEVFGPPEAPVKPTRGDVVTPSSKDESPEERHKKAIAAAKEALAIELERVELNKQGLAGQLNAFRAHLTVLQNLKAGELDILQVKNKIRTITEAIAKEDDTRRQKLAQEFQATLDHVQKVNREKRQQLETSKKLADAEFMAQVEGAGPLDTAAQIELEIERLETMADQTEEAKRLSAIYDRIGVLVAKQRDLEEDHLKQFREGVLGLAQAAVLAAEAFGFPFTEGIQNALAMVGKFVQVGFAAYDAIVKLSASAVDAIPKLISMGQAAWASAGPYGILAAAILAVIAALTLLFTWQKKLDEERRKQRQAAIQDAIEQMDWEVQYGKKTAEQQIAFYRSIAVSAAASAEQRRDAARKAFELEFALIKRRNEALASFKTLMGTIAAEEYDYQQQRLDFLRSIADAEKKNARDLKGVLESIADVKQRILLLDQDTAKREQEILDEGILVRRKSDEATRQDKLQALREQAAREKEALEKKLADLETEKQGVIAQQTAIAAVKAQLSSEEKSALEAILADKRTEIELAFEAQRHAQEAHAIKMKAYAAEAAELGKLIGLNDDLIARMVKQAAIVGQGANSGAAAAAGGSEVPAQNGVTPQPEIPRLPYNPDDLLRRAKEAATWAARFFTGPSDKARVISDLNDMGRMALAVGDSDTASKLRQILRPLASPAFEIGGLIPDEPRFDEMPATLHRGEMILPRDITRGLVEAIRGGGFGRQLVMPVTITGNYFHPSMDMGAMSRDLTTRIAQNLQQKGLF